MSLDLSIVVLHYNRWDLTKDCLASIDAQKIPCSYEKVLVDNGSWSHLAVDEDNNPQYPLGNGWRVVRYEDNRGHIVGQNRCFESAQGEWVLFIANDVRLEPNCIRRLLARKEFLYPPDKPGQLQPRLYQSTGTIDQFGMAYDWPGYGRGIRHPIQSWITYNVPIVPSSCYLMKKEVWIQFGGFDEHLETSYEDVDMGLRLRKAGYWRCLEPTAKALHLGNATLQYQSSHTREAFHRDRLYVLRKHYRGLNYWTRYLAVQLLDHLPRPGSSGSRAEV